MPRVVIVGAGLSGLSLAYRLHQLRPDVAINLLESDNRPGGNVRTVTRDGFRVELGPNGFLDSKPSTLQLCHDLGLGDQLITASESSRKNRFLFLDGKLQQLPGSLWSFVRSPLVNWRTKLRLATEKYRRSTPPDGDESIHDFAARRAGRQAAEVFADALVTGIYAGDPKLLSAAACFPRLVKFEREHGSVMRGFSRNRRPQPQQLRSFRDGLGVLIDALREQCGGELLNGVTVRRIARSDGIWRVHGEGSDSWDADAVVLTSPAYTQAEILADFDADLAEKVGEIQYNRIAVVAIGYRESDVLEPPDGFGYIAPQRTRRDVLGVQWCSAIYPDRAPAGMVLWRALCGGWHRADVVDWDDQRLLNAVRDELRLAHGVTAGPAFHHIARWHRAIPQYHIGHQERVSDIERLAAQHTGLFLGGNAYHGVAMNDCTEQAESLAPSVAAHLSA